MLDTSNDMSIKYFHIRESDHQPCIDRKLMGHDLASVYKKNIIAFSV